VKAPSGKIGCDHPDAAATRSDPHRTGRLRRPLAERTTQSRPPRSTNRCVLRRRHSRPDTHHLSRPPQPRSSPLHPLSPGGYPDTDTPSPQHQPSRPECCNDVSHNPEPLHKSSRRFRRIETRQQHPHQTKDPTCLANMCRNPRDMGLRTGDDATRSGECFFTRSALPSKCARETD
jgi:hypothetical protein